MHTRTHMHTCIHTHMHTRIHTQAHTNEGNVREQIPTPASPSWHNSPYQPPSRKPFANQLAVPTPTRTALIDKPTYSHECYPLLTELPPLSFLSHSSTSLRFSPAPMHSRAHPLSLSHPFTNLCLSLAPTLSRFQQRSPPH
jgi:hypothetical protein